MPLSARGRAAAILTTALLTPLVPASAALAAPAAPDAAAEGRVATTELVEREVEAPAMPAQPGLDRHRRLRSRSVEIGVVYRNLHGARLFGFSVVKYWEYDGRRVTHAPKPRSRGYVTGYGALLGWDYNGVIGHGDHYYSWRGVWHGGHKSWRQAKFSFCPAAFGCFWKRYPSVTIWAHYDGTYSRRVRG